MIQSLLIANRGEIACRVIRTACAMGIRTVAVYSDADADALHVAMANEAHAIGPAPAAQSYLRGDAILEVAARSGADAIHPGYGFLSENAGFARACAKAGVIFVGPPADAINAMGSKDAAKKLMEAAGVPVVPGYHGDDQSSGKLNKEADRIGFPVLIKAVAGGGGKGMKLASTPDEFAAQLESARREAEAAFGNGAVLLEKYLTRARHIEVQVFGDTHGNVVHLFERDCSIQRRHQKVIEEAPAPHMPEAVRQAMGQTAVAAAQAVNYTGAGTVEFIADSSDELDENSFYFMEMNTRLQVEHPVTEAVTGVDLVEWQMRVAMGEPLPLRQDQIGLSGHAVEARLYAEDPARKFLPATGTLRCLRFAPGVRVDTGIAAGGKVTPFYDSMIAKVVAHGATRDQAISTLSLAMKSTAISGVTTNLAFLSRIADAAAFRAGEVETRFIDHHKDTLFRPDDVPHDQVMALAAMATILSRPPAGSDPWDRRDGFRVQGIYRDRVQFAGEGGVLIDIPVATERDTYTLELTDGPMIVRHCTLTQDGIVSTEIDGHRIQATIVRDSQGIDVMLEGQAYRFAAFDPFLLAAAGHGSAGDLAAPMSGKVTKVYVAEGEAVSAGQELMVLEAMKMEHVIRAPAKGTVTTVQAADGQQVNEGEILAIVDAGPEQAATG